MNKKTARFNKNLQASAQKRSTVFFENDRGSR